MRESLLTGEVLFPLPSPGDGELIVPAKAMKDAVLK